eukprot:COSAG02_NODE_370_length_23672_cov_318.104738_12_plen_145_part_00
MVTRFHSAIRLTRAPGRRGDENRSGIPPRCAGRSVGRPVRCEMVAKIPKFSILNLEKHRETGRIPEVTRLGICGTVLKSRNYTVHQYDLRGSDDNLGICQNCTRIPCELNRTTAKPAELRFKTPNHTGLPVRYANVVQREYRYV